MSELRDAFIASKLLASGSKSASITGDTAEFNAPKAAPLTKLAVALEPIQDLHGYANPWPAGGGVNKCPMFADGTHTLNNGMTLTMKDGKITVNGTPTGQGYYEEAITPTVMPSDTYISFNNPASTYNISLVFINSGTQIAAPAPNVVQRTVQPAGLSGATVDTLRVFFSGAGSYNNFEFSPIVHSGSTPQAWVPYTNICPISGHDGANVWVQPTHDTSADPTAELTFPTPPGTVYGGTVDLVSGVLTVDRAYALLNDATKWRAATSGETTVNYVYTGSFDDRKTYADSYTGFMCSAFPIVPDPSRFTARWLSSSSPLFGIRDRDALTDLNGVKALASNGDIAIAYTLAEPITYQLTPQEINALKGSNVIWSDGGAVTVEYSAESVPRGEWPMIMHRLFDVDYPLAVLFSKED